MDQDRNHTDVLQSWLEKLQSSDIASSDEVRRAIINHASGRLELHVRKMLKHYPRLRRWEQTGDVLQNALLRLHHSLSAIRPDSVRQFYGLACKQIRRELIDLSRHHFGPEGAASKHHTDDASQWIDGGSRVERQEDASSEPASLSEWTDFHEAVQRLPDTEREVFDLYWYEGLDQKAIAAILKVSERTVKNRWRNAKLMLRQLLVNDSA